jgi:hypothetical protein
LLLVAAGQVKPTVPGVVPDVPQTLAVEALDEWDGATFERARPVLRYRFPDQHEYLFEGLGAKSGVEAVGSAKLFLDRYAALRDGTDPARELSREEDRQAALLLAERKIMDDETFARISGLVERAQTIAPMPAEPASGPTSEERQAAAGDLHVWLTDWSAQARAATTRGDYLLRLGLLDRRTASKGADDALDEEEEADADPAQVA